VINPASLTSWKVKGKANSSAHAVCDESDVTYSLEGAGGRAIHQPTLLVMNPTSLTSWKVKENGNPLAMLHATHLTSLTCWKVKWEGNSSAHTACDEFDVTYKLEHEGRGQLASPCRTQ